MRAISERQARLWCLALGAAGGVIAGISQLFVGYLVVGIIGLVAGALLAGLTVLYRRGWEPARLVAVALFTAAVIVSFELDALQIGVVISATFALLLAEPWWVVGVGVISAVGIAARGLTGETPTAPFQPGAIPVSILIVSIMAITRLVLESERRKSEELAARAQAAQAASAAQAAELERQTAELTDQNEQQRQLLDLVAVLETPTVTIADGVALAPISGHIDTRRAANLTTRLLDAVSEQRLRLVVLDLSGVPAVDSGVAQSLLRMIQAVQLLGCDVNVSGIAAPVAATMARLGLGLAGVKTWRSPQEALEARRISAGVLE